MAGLHLGFLIGGSTGLYNSSSAENVLYDIWSYNVALGWVMIAAFLVWIGDDGRKRFWVFGDTDRHRTADPVEREA